MDKIQEVERDMFSLFEELVERDREGMECMHDQLELSSPPGQSGTHMVVCNCPKCRTVC